MTVYLDYAASAPLDPRVLEAMLPWLASARAGNAHARHHKAGNAAEIMVRQARTQAAASIRATPDELIFTSGATESNNLFLQGLARHLRSVGKTHIVTSAIEHASVLEPLRALEGFTLTVLSVRPCGGLIEADMVEKALTKQTGLVTIQAVNNETGVIQPLDEIAAMLKGRGILFHSDAAQALGKIAFDVNRSGVDFASLSAHKVYGPQGVGALYIRNGCRQFLAALQHGGGQESGLRPGTLPVALCVGFGAACALIEDDRARIQALRDLFLTRLAPLHPVIHGHRLPAWNAPGILNVGFPGIDSETLVMALPDLAFGVGAACASAGNKYSHVIQALTGSEQAARESIRLSYGRFTTEHDINKAADQMLKAVTDIRKMKAA